MTSKAWGQFKAAVQQVVSGYLYIWGDNSYGQFGNNQVSAANTNSPVQVSSDISAPATPDTSAGENFAVQVRGDGSLWSWGLNQQGSLGNDATTNRSLPVQIGTLTNWRKVAAGNDFAAAIKSDSTLWTWGSNENGKLGIDASTLDRRSSPVQVGTLTNWSKISTNGDMSVAIKTTGELFTWGRGLGGRLGDGGTVSRSSPVQIGTLTNWSEAVAGGNHCLAIKTDGTLWSWGTNTNGNVGDGTAISRSSPVQIGTLTSWTQIFAGDEFSIAIRSDGAIWSWGRNSGGALGLNIATTIARSSPTQIGTLTDWLLVSKGSGSHCAATKTDGTVWAWGENGNGNLGDGTTVNRSSPVQIGASRTWLAARTNKNNFSIYIDDSNNLYTAGANGSGQLGQNTTIARSSPIIIGQQGYWGSPNRLGNSVLITKVNNSLWGWGYNTYGNVGDGTTIDRSSPVQIGTLTNWKSTSQGLYWATLAIKTDGSLWGWGYNGDGSIGNGTTIDRSSPVQIGGNNNWRQVSNSNFSSFAINYSNQLWSWGSASFGVLGQSQDTTPRSSPVQVGALTDWLSVSGGVFAALGLRDLSSTGGARLFVWGYNDYGTIGNNSIQPASSPIQVGTTQVWADATMVGSTVLAIKNDGTLWAWGENSGGNIGDGTVVNKSSPIQIGTLTNWATVRGCASTSFAIKTDGTLWVWGNNLAGTAGVGTYSNISSPVQVGTLTNWSSITDASTFNALGAINNNNQLYAWGSNDYGNLGQNSYIERRRSSPVQLGTDKWISVGTHTTSVAVKDNNTFWSWGANEAGQLGDGTTNDKSSPIQIGTLTNWSLVTIRNNQVASIKTDGSLWAWGDGSFGNIGNGTTTSRSSPVQIGTLTNWKQVLAGGSAKLAVKTDGTLWAWGAGNNGRLGSGDTISRSSPIQIGTLSNWSQVSIGNTNSYAIKTDNTLWSWGANGSGQLGDNTQIDRSSPAQVGTLTNWSWVSAGTNFVTAVKTDGTLWGWGNNASGQVGDGTRDWKSSPVQVGTLTNWNKTFSANIGGPVLAIKTDGTLWGWGGNEEGMLGDNTIINRSSPVQIGSATDWIAVGQANGTSAMLKTT